MIREKITAEGAEIKETANVHELNGDVAEETGEKSDDRGAGDDLRDG
jgi:hypothetical protein